MEKRPGILKVLHAVTDQELSPADDDSLFTSGLLDSFALTDFVVGLEKEFSVKIPDADMTARRFDTIHKVEGVPDGARESRMAGGTAFLRSFGAWLPERVVTNAELAPQLGTDPEWILSVSGIAERRYATGDDTVASLGTRAAEACLARAGLTANDLGMVLVSSGSSERFCPGPASLIAAALGLTMTPALDLPIASAGSLVAVALAAKLAPTTGHILVVGSEIMSRRVAHTPEGKDTAILFGDGAGACIVSPDKGFAAITDTCLFTDGTMAEALAIEDRLLHMDGAAIIRHVSRKLPQAIGTVLERNGVAARSVGIFLLHQANLNLITRIAKSLDAPAERFFANIQRYGNTSSASMLIAAAEWWEQTAGDLREPLVMAAFGVGLNWGAVLAMPPEQPASYN